MITPVVFGSKFIVDFIVAVTAGVLLWIFSFRGMSLNRVEGGLLLLGYFIYLLRTIILRESGIMLIFGM